MQAVLSGLGRTRTLRNLSFLLTALELASAGRVRADDPAFSYQHAEEAHPVRAAAEVLTLLMLGLAHYRFNNGINSLDWEFHYDWPSLRGKLDGTAYAFDTNYFETATWNASAPS